AALAAAKSHGEPSELSACAQARLVRCHSSLNVNGRIERNKMNLHVAAAKTLAETEPQSDVVHELNLTTSAVVAAHDGFLTQSLRNARSERRGLLRTLRRAS